MSTRALQKMKAWRCLSASAKTVSVSCQPPKRALSTNLNNFVPMSLLPALRHVDALTRDMDDLWSVQPNAHSIRRLMGGWSPAVDMREEKDKYLIHAELPGIHKSDVDVQLHNGGVLTISGKKES